GGRRAFDVPLDLKGTDFQMSVWRALLLIPYGRTSSYGSIASALGRPKAVRAVGGANHRNPVSIIVPCHRVIGHDGGLTGYGGGLWRKQWLLDHESKRATRTGDTDGH
ncbi:MAG: methylated-DNA--[protein]-cysteine S-methyltransferase, partial [Synergistaceae bacterium]|nr:methylated-DNA--[protein]-cysteine S-methyltransferase [Synergistaceae bacterium]